MERKERKQEMVVCSGSVSNSNNLTKNYGLSESLFEGNSLRLMDVVKMQSAIIKSLQKQIDRMQDEIEEQNKIFSKTQEIKERLMDMLLDDRTLLKEKVFITAKE